MRRSLARWLFHRLGRCAEFACLPANSAKQFCRLPVLAESSGWAQGVPLVHARLRDRGQNQLCQVPAVARATFTANPEQCCSRRCASWPCQTSCGDVGYDECPIDWTPVGNGFCAVLLDASISASKWCSVFLPGPSVLQSWRVFIIAELPGMVWRRLPNSFVDVFAMCGQDFRHEINYRCGLSVGLAVCLCQTAATWPSRRCDLRASRDRGVPLVLVGVGSAPLPHLEFKRETTTWCARAMAFACHQWVTLARVPKPPTFLACRTRRPEMPAPFADRWAPMLC